MIKVLFFAGLRDAAQTDSINIDVGGIANVKQLVATFDASLPVELGRVLADETAMVSVNQCYAGWDAELQDGDEVGFLPPVSGG